MASTHKNEPKVNMMQQPSTGSWFVHAYGGSISGGTIIIPQECFEDTDHINELIALGQQQKEALEKAVNDLWEKKERTEAEDRHKFGVTYGMAAKQMQMQAQQSAYEQEIAKLEAEVLEQKLKAIDPRTFT